MHLYQILYFQSLIKRDLFVEGTLQATSSAFFQAVSSKLAPKDSTLDLLDLQV